MEGIALWKGVKEGEGCYGWRGRSEAEVGLGLVKHR